MTFRELKASIRSDLFPDGEQENLVAAHDSHFLQAMVDLQSAVPCLRYGNVDVYQQCASYFACGMTVIPQPNGVVTRVYTLGQKQSTGGSTLPPGTSIGNTDFNVSMAVLSGSDIVVGPAVSGTVCTVQTDGFYSVMVKQTNSLASGYAPNSPQYVRTEIEYTDINGVAHTIQPADVIHLSDSDKTAALTVQIKGGTDVKYTCSVFNAPLNDGIINVEIDVAVGTSGSDVLDWCSKVYYDQVDYRHVERYVKACNHCDTSSIWATANAIAAQMFGAWRKKRRYNPPTDEGMENLPQLPFGFHYPQASTDAGGRSRDGVYALKHGRIHIAPWIESNEAVVVEWNGIKTTWSDNDLVSDDPLFKKAVRLNVGIQHYEHYEDNDTRLERFKADYYGKPATAGSLASPGVLRELIVQCRERNRIRSSKEIGNSAADAGVGVGIFSGISSSSNLFYNEAQSFTVSCPDGSSVTPVNVVAGAYSSTLSVADANAAAIADATARAKAALVCSGGTSLYLNTEQPAQTAYCPAANGDTPAADGDPVTIPVPAGQYQGTSQDSANAAALNAALATARSQLQCTYHSAPQQATVTCANGGSQTASVPAGQRTSTNSQAEADGLAYSDAQTAATALCANSAGSSIIGNGAISVPYNMTLTLSCGQTFTFAGSYDVAANTFTAQASSSNADTVLQQVNSQAYAFANNQISALAARAQALNQFRCWRRYA